MIRELSRSRLAWDSLILALIVVSCVLVTYQFAFDQAGALGGFQLLYLFDLFFLVDIGFNCVTTYRSRGVEVVDRKLCTAHYGRRMLMVDIIASVPFDLIAWVLIGNGQFLGGSLILALRLLRLLRIVRLFVILRRWEAFSWSNPAVIRVIKYFVSILLLIHWLACFWFYSAFAAGFPGDSWVARAAVLHADAVDQYVRSLYWTITTMTTVGYGDITPGRTTEYVLAGIIMLMGASLYAFIIGSIASLLNSIHASKNRHWERIESVTEFLRDQKVPAKTNAEVRNYYEHVWERFQGVDRNRMLADLPQPLRLKVLLHLTESIRQTVPLFKHSSGLLRDALLTSLESQTYTPGSIIAHEGDRGRSIFFIAEGDVEIVSVADEKSYGTLSNGDYFGLMSLTLGEQRTASVRALTYCEMLVLDHEDLTHIREEFPEFRDILKQVSAERSEQISALLMEGVVL
jgi:voltage-gated potassium channel